MGPRELEDLGYDHAGLEDCGRQALVGQCRYVRTDGTGDLLDATRDELGDIEVLILLLNEGDTETGTVVRGVPKVEGLAGNTASPVRDKC